MEIIITFLKVIALVGAFLFVLSVLNAIGVLAAPLFGLICLVWTIKVISNDMKK